MTMEPIECQKYALHEVEKLSGKPVIITEERNFPFKSNIKLAYNDEPAHVIFYNPIFSKYLPYLVCFQCGIARRYFICRPEEKVIVTSKQYTLANIIHLVLNNARSNNIQMSGDRLTSFSKMLTKGLGTQIRSIPIGMRVDSFISEEFPSLVEMQRFLLMEQIKEGFACLDPKIKNLTPSLIFKASVGMNAAQAFYWSKKWGEEALKVPYTISGHSNTAEDLLNSFEKTPKEPKEDLNLIKSWAEALQISELFQIGEQTNV